ncbi:hypothetical protein AAFF_G00146930 [Aldrovandia affinis]|uniref:Uncharacterized protein n=1 Tax=Aldrovandia affinis TaxID=143900 RepID=A0AAD7RPZ2_9TELE|nr:hypothetical protein AAFF_G00146930 [Aldrovandia affinis]
MRLSERRLFRGTGPQPRKFARGKTHIADVGTLAGNLRFPTELIQDQLTPSSPGRFFGSRGGPASEKVSLPRTNALSRPGEPVAGQGVTSRFSRPLANPDTSDHTMRVPSRRRSVTRLV